MSADRFNKITFILLIFQPFSFIFADVEDQQLFKIEGKVVVPFTADQEWIASTKIIADGGRYLGFLKSDGSFTIGNLPTGSYVVEVVNPIFTFEPSRVDINSKGKHRARKLNNIQLNAVSTVSYPLKMKARGKARYFYEREKWSITDLIFNPMVLMMVLPLLMVMVLPKLINAQDPETQKEMQSQMNIFTPKTNMPEVSEMVANFFGGGGSSKKPTQITQKSKIKRR